jgi:hypothetical protein
METFWYKEPLFWIFFIHWKEGQNTPHECTLPHHLNKIINTFDLPHTTPSFTFINNNYLSLNFAHSCLWIYAHSRRTNNEWAIKQSVSKWTHKVCVRVQHDNSLIWKLVVRESANNNSVIVKKNDSLAVLT